MLIILAIRTLRETVPKDRQLGARRAPWSIRQKLYLRGVGQGQGRPIAAANPATETHRPPRQARQFNPRGGERRRLFGGHHGGEISALIQAEVQVDAPPPGGDRDHPPLDHLKTVDIAG